MRTADMPVIELRGSGRERGRHYGETLKAEIAHLLDRWEEQIRRDTGQPARTLIEDIVDETRFDAAVARWAPELAEEVRGIAEGSGQPFWRIHGLQLLDEIWWFTLYRKAGAAPWRERSAVIEHCSALGQVKDAGTAYVGQTMDIGTWIEGSQILLRIRSDSGPDQLVFSYAGSIGLNGLNARGIGYCCNTVIQLNPSATGLPMAYVGRRTLEQPSFEAAVDFLKTVEHASGQNYLVGGPGRVASYECSGRNAVEWAGEHGASGPILHTNHPLASRDDRMFREISKGDGALRSTTAGRYDGLKACVRRAGGTLTVDDIKDTLRSKDPAAPISRTGETAADGNPIGYTVGCMVYEHSADPVLHLAAGPPCSTEFRSFRP